MNTQKQTIWQVATVIFYPNAGLIRQKLAKKHSKPHLIN